MVDDPPPLAFANEETFSDEFPQMGVDPREGETRSSGDRVSVRRLSLDRF